MAYSTINKSSDFFNTKLYTGNATNPTTISGIGFQPDWVWTKARSAAEGHRLCDAVRGATKDLISNSAGAETTNAIGLKSFNSDGYVIGNSNGYNQNSQTFVSWNWKGNGAGSSNTDGSITSTVSANAAAGFSIVKFTGTGSVGTIGHGLSSAPKMIIVKGYSNSPSWQVYHDAMGNNKFIELNSNQPEQTKTNIWNSTTPGSSTFTVGTEGDVNGSGQTMIAYCFADVTGHSKIDSYVGNGNADGPFIYTGFKPAFIMVKTKDSADNWGIVDNKRSNYNLISAMLNPNDSGTEGGNNGMDLLSNGFKMKSSDSNSNKVNNTFIYVAVGQSLVGSNNIPATAR